MEDRRVAIVTGSNTGIGRETALVLSRNGFKVFLACRNVDRAHGAAAYIKEIYPDADIEVLLLDLKSLDSVRRCALEFKSRKLPLHVLVNNAGVVYTKPWYTPEFVGGSAQVNFLGPYTFTRLLEDELASGAPSRVVNVSSVMHRMSKFSDPDKFLHQFESGLYPDTKLANVLFTKELQRRWKGKGIHSCAVDPGGCWSDIWRGSAFERPPLSWLLQFVYSPTWDGAKPVVHAALEPFNEPKTESKPFLYFARGTFAWPLVTRPTSSPFFTAILSLCDWPIRRLSRGRFLSQVKEVSAAPSAYDTELASSLWMKAAAVAGFSDQTSIDTEQPMK